MVANQLRPGSGARWLSEIETNGASCVSLNSLASALSVPESASFPRSLGNPACEAELIKAREVLNQPTPARTRTLKAKSDIDRIGVSSLIDLFSPWGQGHKASICLSNSARCSCVLPLQFRRSAGTFAQARSSQG